MTGSCLVMNCHKIEYQYHFMYSLVYVCSCIMQKKLFFMMYGSHGVSEIWLNSSLIFLLLYTALAFDRGDMGNIFSLI